MTVTKIESTDRKPCRMIDSYPSRTKNNSIHIMNRKDPVVYANQLDQSPIPFSLIENFRQDGFLVLDNVFSQKELDLFQEELNSLREDKALQASNESITEPDSGEIRSIFKVHEISPLFKKLSQDRRLAGLAEFILNDKVYIHQSRLNYKPGFRGKDFYWHSDFETWHVEDGMPRMRALSMSVALTQNYYENGPLMLIPGSHNQFVVCEGETPTNHFKASLKKQEYGVPDDMSLEILAKEGGIVSAVGKPGSVIIFDCNTMHGSNSNITPCPRSNVFFVYNALSNKVVDPYCNQPPRPEYICARKHIQPITVSDDQTFHG